MTRRQVKHDAIVKQGTNRDKIVYSQLSNIKEKRGDAEKLQAPTADEEALTAERTRQAFEKVGALPLVVVDFFPVSLWDTRCSSFARRRVLWRSMERASYM